MTETKDQNPNVDTGQGSMQADKPETPEKTKKPKEIGGRAGPEPTRYGDWEKNGIISDF